MFSDLHPICSLLVTHVTIFEYFFSRKKTLDIENKDNNLHVHVYEYRTEKVWYVDGMKAMLIRTFLLNKHLK